VLFYASFVPGEFAQVENKEMRQFLFFMFVAAYGVFFMGFKVPFLYAIGLFAYIYTVHVESKKTGGGIFKCDSIIFLFLFLDKVVFLVCYAESKRDNMFLKLGINRKVNFVYKNNLTYSELDQLYTERLREGNKRWNYQVRQREIEPSELAQKFIV